MECENCFYYGWAADAPETAEEECMWMPSEEDGDHRPCEEECMWMPSEEDEDHRLCEEEER